MLSWCQSVAGFMHGDPRYLVDVLKAVMYWCSYSDWDEENVVVSANVFLALRLLPSRVEITWKHEAAL